MNKITDTSLHWVIKKSKGSLNANVSLIYRQEAKDMYKCVYFPLYGIQNPRLCLLVEQQSVKLATKQPLVEAV